MEKIIKILLFIISILMFSSCDTFAQEYYIGEHTIVYEYSYRNYPVRYVNGIPYYYCLIDNIWNWYVLPITYHTYIVHHRPLRYSYHRNVYNMRNSAHHNSRTYYHHYNNRHIGRQLNHRSREIRNGRR